MASSSMFRPSPHVSLWVTSPDTHSERKFDTGISIAALKLKLEPITGIPLHFQSLSLLRSDEGELIANLSDENASLASFGVADWMAIRVNNLDPTSKAGGEFTDMRNVQKFELTEEEYERRSDTVHSYLKQHRLGPRFAQESSPVPLAPATTPSASHAHVGDRCEVDNVGRGVVKFVGETEFGVGGGHWVGVQLDEPVGKNDGSINGKSYFETKPSYGVFVRGDKVKTGDFPPEENWDMEDEDEEM